MQWERKNNTGINNNWNNEVKTSTKEKINRKKKIKIKIKNKKRYNKIKTKIGKIKKQRRKKPIKNETKNQFYNLWSENLIELQISSRMYVWTMFSMHNTQPRLN